MNFFLTDIPNREKKPREHGLTMMMDKGLSINDTKNFIDMCGPHTDIVKLGFGTSAISPHIETKIKLYQDAGLMVYLGGTLFEAFIIRDMYEEFKDLLRKWNLSMCEVSDGSIELEHVKKCKYISDLAEEFLVVSEVGSKDEKKLIAPYKWIELMQKELDAGAWKVIAEAREGGNVGIYRSGGEVRSDLIDEILTQIPTEKILWEAPKKPQQVWFIKLLGPNVNLGNISWDEVIPLETLRIGLRGDTFFDYLKKS
ncbi:MAG: phosphosulfolactate synthase [Flavobacteriales bacterium]|jgi:phosphosulfolactate synthase|nr:phosphosulfolactate synthase [Flavobacteriales bacterium]MBT7481717.1 phosphosulfolactate synthase [Flavobacteriales bacterium]